MGLPRCISSLHFIDFLELARPTALFLLGVQLILWDILLTDNRNAYYAPHQHNGLTTHLILTGHIDVSLPGKRDKRVRHGPGERVDIEPNTSHEVWVGEEGCTMIVGE